MFSSYSGSMKEKKKVFFFATFKKLDLGLGFKSIEPIHLGNYV